MNNILSLVCLGGFLLLRFAVLLLRAFRRKFMPWWLAFLAVAALGWLLINGAVYFSFAHLGGLIHSYGDNPPADLVEDWANDGAKRVFALFFGWVYALVSFVPLLLIYGLIQLLGRCWRSLMKPLALLLLCPMAACRPAGSSRETSGTQAERVAAVSKLVTRHSPLPSPLLDANFVEEQTGDGRLGPSDFKSFCALSVAQANLPAWRAPLAPLEAQNTPPEYAASWPWRSRRARRMPRQSRQGRLGAAPPRHLPMQSARRRCGRLDPLVLCALHAPAYHISIKKPRLCRFDALFASA